MSWMDTFNPLTRVGTAEYATFWQTLFATIFLGLWSRVIAVTFLFLSFWYGIRRRNFIVGFWTFLLAGFIAYGAALFRFAGLLVR